MAEEITYTTGEVNTKELVKTMSTIMKAKQPDGSFIPVFPIITANEVYTDIDNGIKLSTYLQDLSSISTSRSVDTLDDMFALSSSDVKLNECIRTIDEGRYFIVIDLDNLNSPAGYLEILTTNMIGKPNGLATLDENGELPIKVHPAAEFITYSR